MRRGSPKTADDRRTTLVKRMRDIADGDRAALNDVYDMTSAKLFGICLRILQDRPEAEDVLQDVFVTVWARASDFDASRASPITWLSTIARNRAIDRLRQIGRRGEADWGDAPEMASDAPDALGQLEDEEDRQRLAACLDDLDERARAAIQSAFFGGMTYQELASRGEMPLGTIKSIIRRGLIRLKGCLSQ